MPLEVRNATATSENRMKGSATGRVDTNTSRKTPSAPARSSRVICGRGKVFMLFTSAVRIPSSTATGMILATPSGKACATMRYPASASAAAPIARAFDKPLPSPARLVMIYITASTMPQAMLQLRAAYRIWRMSCSPAEATLMVPVKAPP